ncbi:hypothetical protein BGZ63DRAFT_401418 [Mariannaea sp. PMI_226]|nr:hypothetical protein BGZ63DRAFT_401418 [Mariannaea sp. PMI_226]
MGSLTKQPSRLFNLKLVRKHFPESSSNTRSRAESSPQPTTNRPVMTKGRGGSVGSNSSVPGLIDDRSESEKSFDEATDHHHSRSNFRYQRTSDDIWNSFFQPGPGETREDVQLLLSNQQYPAQLTAAELGSLEQPSPPPTKPLPAIPPHARPRTAPQRHIREEEDHPLPPWSHQNTLPQNRKPVTAYSPFPKPLPLPPRTTSNTPSWQCSRQMQKPQKTNRPEPAYPRTEPHLNADHYRDMSQDMDKTDEEVRFEAFQELLAKIVRDPPKQKSITGSCGQDFIRPLDEIIMSDQAETVPSSPEKPPSLDLVLPPIEDDWDEFTPILSRPDSSQALLLTECFTTETIDSNAEHTPSTPVEKHRLLSFGSTGATLEAVKRTSSEYQLSEAETCLKVILRDEHRFLPTNRSAMHLPSSDLASRSIFSKKSVPDLRKVPKLQSPPSKPSKVPRVAKAIKAVKNSKVSKTLNPPPSVGSELPTQSVWEEDEEEVRRRFDLFRILHRRGGSEGRRSSKNNGDEDECRRLNSGSEPPSPRSPRDMWNSMFGRHRK